MRTIWTAPDNRYRIVEHPCDDFTLDDLKGDTYRAELHPEIPSETIRAEERAFEELVEREGVFGYVLEYWNPSPGIGWVHMDSCWGFVGSYCASTDSNFNHYIVDEMKSSIA